MEDVSYLTEEGYAKMQEELARLKGPEREALSARLRAAIQQGDLSENADYISAKEEQGFLEGKIQDLERTLRNVVIIDESSAGRTVVNIGAHITIQEGNYPAEKYQVVGPKEADPKKNRISHESPIGKAVLGKGIGDIATADTPGGIIQFKIIAIE
ncbi:transcription elongation factor GreA [Leptolinea tardivitalis]|uniref:Transcription elongation factor GreA n=1 Tax=Leptolinea tardivitalis TaxID=229920 RepID=A0A0N8GLA0_9CHLR|nr:transcription elongation factor GreA [Leptolinea tardivitalis]KPL71914.1 transcription elongation factor GreA [Leptolinea tardivitalis]GAP20326.1 transcription elongation factor GreA [Leptolinea tardivitalis]